MTKESGPRVLLTDRWGRPECRMIIKPTRHAAHAYPLRYSPPTLLTIRCHPSTRQLIHDQVLSSRRTRPSRPTATPDTYTHDGTGPSRSFGDPHCDGRGPGNKLQEAGECRLEGEDQIQHDGCTVSRWRPTNRGLDCVEGWTGELGYLFFSSCCFVAHH